MIGPVTPEQHLAERCAAYRRGFDDGVLAARQEAVKVAKQVGGKFWATHRLNAGLLKFIKVIDMAGRDSGGGERGAEV